MCAEIVVDYTVSFLVVAWYSTAQIGPLANVDAVKYSLVITSVVLVSESFLREG